MERDRALSDIDARLDRAKTKAVAQEAILTEMTHDHPRRLDALRLLDEMRRNVTSLQVISALSRFCDD